MPADARLGRAATWYHAVDHWAATRPDAVFMAPFIAYLVVMGFTVALPPEWQPAGVALRGLTSLAAVWLLRRHLPAWGRAHWPLVIVVGAFAAWGWIAGQYLFNDLGIPVHLPLFPGAGGETEPDLRDTFGAGGLFRTMWVLRMIVACTAVPVVEELFWRAFMLRALIDWHHFERVPLGQFSWRAFLGTALLSTLQHPDNWAVSIPCWLLFNLVFYRTRSILCLVLIHGMTNLALYLMVLRVDDWSFL